MNLRRREKIIALVAAAVVGLWLADRLVLTPVWEAYQADRERAWALQEEWFRAERLLAHAKALSAEHERRMAAGLGLPASQAEGQMVDAVVKWAAQAGLSPPATRPDRAEAAEGVQVIRCPVAAQGPMSALVGVCWRMETAEIPLRIERLRVSAPDSTTDRLAIQLEVSTVCLDADASGSDEPTEAGGTP